MSIRWHEPTVEAILTAHRAALGADFLGYRNHVYRVIHLCEPGDDPDDVAKIQIAASFHDLGIWTQRTLDYLAPSASLAAAHLRSLGLAHWQDEIVQMIVMHHAVRRRPDASPLVEAFRRADMADFSRGWLRMGLSAQRIAQVQAAFPNAGFHLRLAQLGVRWALRYPWRPLPMFRW